MHIVDLRTERRTNPLGLDCAVPRFSWQLRSAVRNARQTAFEIEVARSEAELSAGRLVWQSDVVATGQSQFVAYNGPALASRQRYYWRVRVWDQDNAPTDWSDPAWFEMGLDQDDWQARWISRAGQAAPAAPEPPTLFRREFNIGTGLVSARLYATAQGVYTVSVNGAAVGDLVLAPGWTSYRHQIQYQVHDVTALLASGANTIGATLGDGWFRGPIFPDAKNHRPIYGDRSALLLQLELVYEDGRRETVSSDASWRQSTGSILASTIYDGETQDARREPKGWREAGYDDAQWGGVDELPRGSARLIAQNGSPLRRMGELVPQAVTRAPSGKVIVDFGQNMVGWVKVTVRGEAGRTIVLRHGEILDAQGELYTENLRQAEQTCRYILCGDGLETFEPNFTFQGFRYVEIEGMDEEEAAAGLLGIVVHSDMRASGSFDTSSALLNQLQSNILWGQKGNFIDVPLDCPQRDERVGWTGDAQAFAPTASFNMDVHGFFKRWLSDMALEQREDGRIPFVIPDTFGPGGAAGWSDAATIIPMVLYRRYGDRQLLETHYPMMCRWAGYVASRAGDDHIWKGDYQFGDWLDFFSATRGVDNGLTSPDLIATAFYAHSTALVRDAAHILGKTDDAALYAARFESIRRAFCARFVSAEGVIGEDTQAAYVFPLCFGLLDEDVVPKAAARLAADVRFRGHLTTGFLATPLLLDALTDTGYMSEAMSLLLREEYPSWLYPVTKGATTIWERWGGIKPDGSLGNPGMNSFNHYAYGAVGDWMYRTLGGLSPEAGEPGFRRFNAMPRPVSQLDRVRLHYDGPYGLIVLGWERKDGDLIVDLEVPVNSEARLKLPAADVANVMEGGVPLSRETYVIDEDGPDLTLRLGAGDYRFRYPFVC